MDTGLLVEGWKRQLLDIASDPPFVFRDTPQVLIDRLRLELSTLCGFPEPQVARLEAKLGTVLPEVIRTFWLHLAKSRGGLFSGSDLPSPSDFLHFRNLARKLLPAESTLPRNAVVFLVHQGYTFLYFLAGPEADPSVWQWSEGRSQPCRAAESFSALVGNELALMESTDEDWRRRGGYYKTLHPEGGGTDEFPSLAQVIVPSIVVPKALNGRRLRRSRILSWTTQAPPSLRAPNIDNARARWQTHRLLGPWCATASSVPAWSSTTRARRFGFASTMALSVSSDVNSFPLRTGTLAPPRHLAGVEPFPESRPRCRSADGSASVAFGSSARS